MRLVFDRKGNPIYGAIADDEDDWCTYFRTYFRTYCRVYCQFVGVLLAVVWLLVMFIYPLRCCNERFDV